jgi:sugar phosphate isomerase/epimerase
MISRRRFVAATLAAGVVPALRAVPALHEKAGAARLRLSLAAYSFRDDFVAAKDGTPARLDMFKFIDFCAENDVPGAELTSYYFKPNPDGEYLARVRRHAHLRGVTVSGTAVGNNFTLPAGEKREAEIASVLTWIERAAVLGAPHIRVFAGKPVEGQSKEEAKKQCVAALEQCGEAAGKHGIFLGVENHGGIVAEAADLLDIVRAVGSPWVGINLDTGNFHTDDPWGDLARCAPYAVNVQYKAYVQARGAKEKSPGDAARMVKMLRDAGYSGWVALEYELKEDPWKAVPAILSDLRPHLG